MTGQFWMRIQEKERGQFPKVKVAYTVMPCMHCDSPACTRLATGGEIYRRADGIVIIDPQKAVGHKELVSGCPYRVIYWNEEKGLPQKCTMCAHLLDQGYKEPRCVEACPTGALTFGDLNDKNSEISVLIATGKVAPMHPEYAMHEKVQYIGLPAKFVAGSVVFGDSDACAENVNVTLISEGIKQTIQTNNYGDFEFEGLESDKKFQVKIDAEGYHGQVLEAITRNDVYLGDILLTKSAPKKKAVKK
jgi:Fe-S-cluster-containing dehydrogenase component